MKKLLFPSAILCALCSTAFVTSAYADVPVTSHDATATWGIYNYPPPVLPVSMVQVVVGFGCNNPNSTTKSFDEPFSLYRDYGTSQSNVSNQWLHNDIAPGDGPYEFTFHTTDYPSTGSSWYVTYFLPGDQDAAYPNIAASRLDNHTY